VATSSAIVDRISNANFGNRNAGITSAGAHLGLKFQSNARGESEFAPGSAAGLVFCDRHR